MLLGLWLVPAHAHEYQTHVLEPRADWCTELHRVAQPGDVVQLSPGHYPGGCNVTVGGLTTHNEPLVIASFEADVTIGADTNGLSLGLLGETTRIYGLELQGRTRIAADGVSVDYSRLAALEVDPDVTRLVVLFSQLDTVDLTVETLNFRGNQVGDLTLFGSTGIVADNRIDGSATTDLPFQRNLVNGDLTAVDAYANVVVGHTDVSGRLWGNTLLGPVQTSDPRNNLTTEADLDPASGNLLCADCLQDASILDVRPTGEALTAPLVEATDDRFDYCREPRTHIGAMGTSVDADLPWTAWDRDREGCASDVYVPPSAIDSPSLEAEPTVQRGCTTASTSSLLERFLRW